MFVGDDSTIHLFLKINDRKQEPPPPPRRAKRERKLGPVWIAVGGALILWLAVAALRRPPHATELSKGKLAPVSGPSASASFTKEMLAAALEAPLARGIFPEALALDGSKMALRYTLDNDAQVAMQKLFESYRPDYGAFVAIDATTGRVLSLVSYTREAKQLGNLTLKAMFPAASVIKIVTATAAIDQSRATPETVIAFRGGNHTLLKRHVTEEAPARGARKMTLREAFAKSVNTVFARIGAFKLKPVELEEYARRFLFNQAFAAGIPVEPGKFGTDTVGPSQPDRWLQGELASGFNHVNLMSPLQGAMIAAAIANDGAMMEPFLVEEVDEPGGRPLFRSEPRLLSSTMTADSAEKMRALMRETVAHGTSRRYFHTFIGRGIGRTLDVGGKTGSLTSLAPKGHCDWFVGYARDGARKIAVAALTVNERQWKVKSSYLARTYLERSFRGALH